MHHIYRVHCISKTCKDCAKAVFIKTGILGDKLYMCPPIQKKHKEIDARDCGEFSCNDAYWDYSFCNNCAGAPVKKLKRW